MNRRFDKINSEYRENIRRVNTRQQMAHPMSEFLGTVMIVIVLWFGGVLVLNNMTLSAPRSSTISLYSTASSIR